jgi:hypothetical protein
MRIFVAMAVARDVDLVDEVVSVSAFQVPRVLHREQDPAS